MLISRCLLLHFNFYATFEAMVMPTQGSNDDSKKMREAQKALRAGLSKLDKVLPAVLRQSGLEKRLREHAVFGLWPAVAGDKLSERSRPVYIDSQMNIVITASDSAVAQEIALCRIKLLQSLAPLSRAAGVEIRGIRVDLKHYHRRPEPEPEVEVVTLPEPDDQALVALELGVEQKLLLENLRRDLENHAEPQRAHINKRVLITYEKQLRLSMWRKARGFPICQQCGFAVSRLHNVGGNKVCFNCQIAEKQEP